MGTCNPGELTIIRLAHDRRQGYEPFSLQMLGAEGEKVPALADPRQKIGSAAQKGDIRSRSARRNRNVGNCESDKVDIRRLESNQDILHKRNRVQVPSLGFTSHNELYLVEPPSMAGQEWMVFQIASIRQERDSATFYYKVDPRYDRDLASGSPIFLIDNSRAEISLAAIHVKKASKQYWHQGVLLVPYFYAFTKKSDRKGTINTKRRSLLNPADSDRSGNLANVWKKNVILSQCILNSLSSTIVRKELNDELTAEVATQAERRGLTCIIQFVDEYAMNLKAQVNGLQSLGKLLSSNLDTKALGNAGELGACEVCLRGFYRFPQNKDLFGAVCWVMAILACNAKNAVRYCNLFMVWFFSL